MIEHEINYFENGYSLQWVFYLPYRLIAGDIIEWEMLDKNTDYKKQTEAESLFGSVSLFKIDRITISRSYKINCWIKRDL